MSDLEWIVFIGLSAAVPVGILVWMALKRPRQDDLDPPYRNRGYEPTAQRLPREPAPLPTNPNDRFIVTSGVEGALHSANRNSRVPQITVRTSPDGKRLIVRGGKGVGALVNELNSSGALDFFTWNRKPDIEVDENPTLGKREEWTWTGSRLDQVPPSMRYLYDDDED